jgi:hypothetical protein
MAFNAEDFLLDNQEPLQLKGVKGEKLEARPVENRGKVRKGGLPGRMPKKWNWVITRKKPKGASEWDPAFTNPIATVPMTSKTNPSIPLDTYGARLWQINQGSRFSPNRLRNPYVDASVRAEIITNPKSKNLEDITAGLQWYVLPNESDIEQIDTPGSLYMPPQNAKAKVHIFGATEEEEDFIQQTLKNAFSNEEQRIMRNLIIEVKPDVKGAAGYYRGIGLPGPRDTAFNKVHGTKTQDPDQIVLNRNYLKRKGKLLDNTIVHEMLHFLRNRDPYRNEDPVNRAARGYGTVRDQDLEESFTDLETLVRSEMNPNRKESGYYYYASQPRILSPVAEKLHKAEKQKKNPSQKDLVILEDYALGKGLADHDNKKIYDKMLSRPKLTREVEMPGVVDFPTVTVLGRGSGKTLIHPAQGYKKGLDEMEAGEKLLHPFDSNIKAMLKPSKGKRAIKRTNKIYPHSIASSAKIRSKNEPIDNYFVHKNKAGEKVSTHIYSPQAILTEPQLRALATPPLAKKGSTLSQWKDGKLVKSQVPRNAQKIRTNLFK